jgi:hypothetical protein
LTCLKEKVIKDNVEKMNCKVENVFKMIFSLN